MGIVTSLRSIDRLLKTGNFSYLAGTNGTANVPSGKAVTYVRCFNDTGIVPGVASVTIAGGDSITVDANAYFEAFTPEESLVGPASIVFTGTSAYYVGMVDVV